jgi:hypothetical protein
MMVYGMLFNTILVNFQLIQATSNKNIFIFRSLNYIDSSLHFFNVCIQMQDISLFRDSFSKQYDC